MFEIPLNGDDILENIVYVVFRRILMQKLKKNKITFGCFAIMGMFSLLNYLTGTFKMMLFCHLLITGDVLFSVAHLHTMRSTFTHNA